MDRADDQLFLRRDLHRLRRDDPHGAGAALSLIPTSSALYKELAQAVGSARCLVLAGLPGIGKSLLTQQAALIAADEGRPATQMQWDVVRAAFEEHPAGGAFPPKDGIANPVVRLAA